ncbi:MAG: nuclear transport factor 2 family protein [Myxococcaceae bacterium]|jgi:ketosteroid isomerase-like protein|nr:nuclear transport factor 2 family protein [Myxococcaceae bacterium]
MKVQRTGGVVSTNPGQAAAAAAAPEVTASVEPTAGWAPRGPARVAAAASAPTPTEVRNRATAERFFEAFGRRDLATVEALYRPDATFKDDMFTLTKGGRGSIMQMWRGAPPFKVFLAEVTGASGNQVRAKWVAEYEMFGRQIRNEIDSTLTFDEGGAIRSQVESWDRQKWMSQALPFVPRWAQGAVYAVLSPLLSWRLGG